LFASLRLILPLHFNNNCIVMLDGQGGDETLFGYENYYSVNKFDFDRICGFYKR